MDKRKNTTLITTSSVTFQYIWPVPAFAQDESRSSIGQTNKSKKLCTHGRRTRKLLECKRVSVKIGNKYVLRREDGTEKCLLCGYSSERCVPLGGAGY